jgi:hypothetical protein
MGGSPDGGGIPASMETGQPEGCPARATITRYSNGLRTTAKMGAPEQDTKKTHGASGVAMSNTGSTPGCRFCDSGKLYLETAKGSKPEKGAFCGTGIIMRHSPGCVRRYGQPSTR